MNVTKQHLAGACGKVNPICHDDFYSGVHGRDAFVWRSGLVYRRMIPFCLGRRMRAHLRKGEL